MMMIIIIIVVVVVIMSMGWDYVSDLQPPAGLLFIPHMIYELENAWWNDVDRGKLIRPPDLWQSYQQSHLVASISNGQAKGIMNLTLRSIFIHTCKWFLTCHKILWRGADGFTSPPKEGVLRIFVAPIAFEPANLWSNVMHADHYTFEATSLMSFDDSVSTEEVIM
jgi:hypothetical protein